MREFDNDPDIAQTVELINSYGLDLHGYTIPEIISQLLAKYHSNWIRLATIEALYLGRYKAVSVEQILRVWSRKGSPNPHFGHEFERLICRKLPRNSAYLPKNTVANKNIIPAEPKQTRVSPISSPDNNLENTPTEQKKLVDSTINDRTKRSPSLSEQQSIDRFTPLPDPSSFYNKLKSLAEEEAEED